MTVFIVGVLPRLGLELRTIGQQPNALTVRPFSARPFNAFKNFKMFEFIQLFMVLYGEQDGLGLDTRCLRMVAGYTGGQHSSTLQTHCHRDTLLVASDDAQGNVGWFLPLPTGLKVTTFNGYTTIVAFLLSLYSQEYFIEA